MGIVAKRADSGDNSWLDPQSSIANAAFTCASAILLPFLCLWTAVGMHWLGEGLEATPDCIAGGYLTLLVCAQVLCVVTAVAYLVIVGSVWDVKRCRKANAIAIRSVEDGDLVNRWGPLRPAPTMELC